MTFARLKVEKKMVKIREMQKNNLILETLDQIIVS